MLHVACCLWDANQHTQPFSLGYSEVWVERLYRGFKRNLTRPFRFVVFTDRQREFHERAIDQELLATSEPNYGCMIEPFKLNEPTIIVGLDTVILGNIDEFAGYCNSGEFVALPRNPYKPEQSINPIVLVPSGWRKIYDEWRGENDMEWLRMKPTAFIDDRWPGSCLSIKAHDVRRMGTQDAKVIYAHGRPKFDELTHLDWVKEHWV